MKNAFFCSIALALTLSSAAWAQSTEKKEVMEQPKTPEKDKSSAPSTPAPKPPENAKSGTDSASTAKAVTCTLLTKEAPRGGRLEVQGNQFGKSPVVKIGSVVTRIIERPGDKIAVQIPPKSDGGAVIVRVDGKDIACGTLTIIGLD